MSGSQAHLIPSRAAIKPHRTAYWIMSAFSRKDFEERMGELFGLYMSPPETAPALVVSIEKKTGIRANSLISRMNH